jgi:hypothetical protein
MMLPYTPEPHHLVPPCQHGPPGPPGNDYPAPTPAFSDSQDRPDTQQHSLKENGKENGNNMHVREHVQPHVHAEEPTSSTRPVNTTATPPSSQSQGSLQASTWAKVAAAPTQTPPSVNEGDVRQHLRKRCKETNCVLAIAPTGSPRVKALAEEVRLRTGLTPLGVTTLLQFPRVAVIAARGPEHARLLHRLTHLETGGTSYMIDTCMAPPQHEYTLRGVVAFATYAGVLQALQRAGCSPSAVTRVPLLRGNSLVTGSDLWSFRSPTILQHNLQIMIEGLECRITSRDSCFQCGVPGHRRRHCPSARKGQDITPRKRARGTDPSSPHTRAKGSSAPSSKSVGISDDAPRTSHGEGSSHPSSVGKSIEVDTLVPVVDGGHHSPILPCPEDSNVHQEALVRPQPPLPTPPGGVKSTAAALPASVASPSMRDGPEMVAPASPTQEHPEATQEARALSPEGGEKEKTKKLKNQKNNAISTPAIEAIDAMPAAPVDWSDEMEEQDRIEEETASPPSSPDVGPYQPQRGLRVREKTINYKC